MGMLHGFRGLIYVEGVSLDTHSASIQRLFQLNATVTPSNATNQNIVWTSSDTSIATVNNNGLVTPIGEGNITITATLDGHTDSCELEVELIPVIGVSLNKSSTTIQIGETEQLVATITPNDASNKSVTWSSSNTSVATVDSTGLVTYVGDGSCTITVTTVDGSFTDTCSVTCVSKRKVWILLIGGGGGGGAYGGGGGGGGYIECTEYEMDAGSYPVVIGNGGVYSSNTYQGCNGGNSTFNGLVACGGGGGGGYNGYQQGSNGGSGGGGGYSSVGAYNGKGTQGQGNDGGCNQHTYSGGGGGGAGGVGGDSRSRYYGGLGGVGKCSCISGVLCRYSGGGGGGNGAGYSDNNGGCGGGGHGGYQQNACNNATYYGGGGGGHVYGTAYGCGYQGIFILAYPSSCGYNITGGTKYECNGNYIHCFTGNGTLVIE